MGWACGEFTPQIMPIGAFAEEIDMEKLGLGLSFFVQTGTRSPDDIDSVDVPWNEFELKGYYYYTLQDGRRFLHPRFDLIGWRPIAPFKEWTSGGGTRTRDDTGDYSKFWNGAGTGEGHFSVARKYYLECR